MSDRIAFNTFSCAGAPIEGLLDEIKNAGYMGVGLWSGHVAELLKLGRVVRDDWGLTAISNCVRFVGGTEPSREIRELVHAIELTSAMKIESVVVIPSAEWITIDNWTLRFCDLLGEVLTKTEALGTRVDLEPLHPSLKQHSALLDIATSHEILGRLNHSRVGWILDVLHVAYEDARCLSSDLIRRITSVHVADRHPDKAPDHRVGPGDGTLPLDAYLSHLIRAGYQAWWEVETTDTGGDPEQRPDFLRRARAGLERMVTA